MNAYKPTNEHKQEKAKKMIYYMVFFDEYQYSKRKKSIRIYSNSIWYRQKPTNNELKTKKNNSGFRQQITLATILYFW